MSLKLYFHPLSSFCQKVLVALYENGTPFEPRIVDLCKPSGGGVQEAVADRQVPGAARRSEGSHGAGVEHHHRVPGSALSGRDAVPARRSGPCPPDAHAGSLLRPLPAAADAEDRRRQVAAGRQERSLRCRAGKGAVADCARHGRPRHGSETWATGDTFGMADCAAAPALYYANLVAPFASTHPHAAAYLDRLMHRPSFARAVKEAEPYRKFFPQ